MNFGGLGWIGFLTQLTFLRIWIRVLQGQWKGRSQNEYQHHVGKFIFLLAPS